MANLLNKSGNTVEYNIVQHLSDEDFEIYLSKMGQVADKKNEKMIQLRAMAQLKKELKAMHEENDFVFANIGLTKPELEKKYNSLIELVIKGKTKVEILNFARKEYSLTEKDATLLYYQALKYMKAISKEDKEELRERHYFMLNNLYQKALEEGDRKEAREVLNSIQKLYGIQEKQPSTQNNIQINSDSVEFKFNMPSAESKIRRKDIEAKPTDYEDLNSEGDSNG